MRRPADRTRAAYNDLTSVRTTHDRLPRRPPAARVSSPNLSRLSATSGDFETHITVMGPYAEELTAFAGEFRTQPKKRQGSA